MSLHDLGSQTEGHGQLKAEGRRWNENERQRHFRIDRFDRVEGYIPKPLPHLPGPSDNISEARKLQNIFD